MTNLKKRCKCIILPTTNKSNIRLRSRLEYNSSASYRINPQHLYITSDDEIEIGGWVYTGKIEKVIDITNKHYNIVTNKATYLPEDCVKIIATTDTSLVIENPVAKKSGGGDNWFKPLLQPSKLFITKFIEKYNKGNIIEDVLVEYVEGHINVYKETIPTDISLQYFNELGQYSGVKISKDNTITIKKIKNSFTLQEVIELCNEAYEYGGANCFGSDKHSFKHFKDKNL